MTVDRVVTCEPGYEVLTCESFEGLCDERAELVDAGFRVSQHSADEAHAHVRMFRGSDGYTIELTWEA